MLKHGGAYESEGRAVKTPYTTSDITRRKDAYIPNKKPLYVG